MTGFTRLLLVRHGETDHNATHRLQGQLDIGLNALGLAQAAALPQALAHELIQAIYTSDLLRTVQTAEPLSRALGLPAYADVGLRERAFGEFEGLAFEEIANRWPDLTLRWRSREPGFGAPGGETLAGFAQRSVQAVAELAQRHGGQTIAVVTHGGVLDSLYRAAAGVDLQAPRSWRLPNAAINRLLFSEGQFSLVGWCDDAHLLGIAA
ncbi:MAG: histidine phosphatase family protein [Aquabacterium sp.]